MIGVATRFSTTTPDVGARLSISRASEFAGSTGDEIAGIELDRAVPVVEQQADGGVILATELMIAGRAYRFEMDGRSLAAGIDKETGDLVVYELQ